MDFESIIVVLAQGPGLLLVFLVADLDLDLFTAFCIHSDLDCFVTVPLNKRLLGRQNDRRTALTLHDEIALAKSYAAAQEDPGNVVLRVEVLPDDRISHQS